MSGNVNKPNSAAKLEHSASHNQPAISFDQAIAIVQMADGLKEGVRSNMVGAVRRAATLMPGAAGTTGIIQIKTLQRALKSATAAKMGYRHTGSFSAFKSNLQRALQLAGFTVMPARHSTPLTAAWATLLDRTADKDIKRSLSRLAHVASEQKWAPETISDAHVERFRRLVDETCLKSKANKVERSTIKAWNTAKDADPDWPGERLGAGASRDWYYSLPWSDFPPSFQADVDAYLARGQSATDFLDWEADDSDALGFLEPRTQENYRDGLKRAASILARTGVPADTIVGIGSLVAPERTKAILNFLVDRLQRKDGGLVGLVAMLLYVAARDWVYPKAEAKSPEAKAVADLKRYFERTKQKNPGMSEKTQARVAAFEDPRVLAAYLSLPETLLAQAKKSPVDADSARLVRLSLFVAISIDTLLRPGNIVSLSLKDQLQIVLKGNKRELFIRIPKTKNGMTFTGKVRSRTLHIFDLYKSKYRPLHGKSECDWLFPRDDGQHWPEGRAYEALNDYCAKHLGIDMTPHVHRALGGQIILAANPGALFDVQQMLVHKRLSTTRTSYVPYEMAATQDRYHALLAQHDLGKAYRS